MTGRRLSHDWFDAALPPNVELGERSWLYSTFAFRHYASESAPGLRVGHDTGLYKGTFFDLGPTASVKIGNFCTVVGAIVATNGCVSIGDFTFIAHEVVIADNPWMTPWTSRAIAPTSATSRIAIGANVWIGARAIVCGSIEIGTGAVIGAAAIVSTSVPPYAIFAGNPARQVGVVRR